MEPTPWGTSGIIELTPWGANGIGLIELTPWGAGGVIKRPPWCVIGIMYLKGVILRCLIFKICPEGQKFNNFDEIAKMENTIHIDESRCKTRVQGLRKQNSPLTLGARVG